MVVKKNEQNAFYNIPTTKSKRATSFGYGCKLDFTATVDKVPAPNHYKGVDNMHGFGKRGITMGTGRDLVTFSGFSVKQKKVPGPGAYDTLSNNIPHIKGFNIKQNSTS